MGLIFMEASWAAKRDSCMLLTKIHYPTTSFWPWHDPTKSNGTLVCCLKAASDTRRRPAPPVFLRICPFWTILPARVVEELVYRWAGHEMGDMLGSLGSASCWYQVINSSYSTEQNGCDETPASLWNGNNRHSDFIQFLREFIMIICRVVPGVRCKSQKGRLLLLLLLLFSHLEERNHYVIHQPLSVDLPRGSLIWILFSVGSRQWDRANVLHEGLSASLTCRKHFDNF